MGFLWRLMKAGLVVFLLLAAVLFSDSQVRAEQNGGTPCAACTVVLQIVFNLMVDHPDTFDHVLLSYCTTLPEPYTTPCIAFAHQYGASLVERVGAGASADQLCRSLGVCTSTTCNLMPNRVGLRAEKVFQEAHRVPLGSRETPWLWLEESLDRLSGKWTEQHEPLLDIDGDFFVGYTEGLRGRHWRGRDCDNLSNEVYPGRQSSRFPDAIDHDCNGISGRDHLGRSYEKQLCGDSDRRGIISLGDSATAHFRIPPQYLNASDYKPGLFDNVVPWGLDEADWPHRSWGTGHLNDTTGDCEGPLDSIYLNMLHRNRCNFRDFQNIGVNGARTSSMAPPGIINSMARTSNDHPALVIYALVGNDVCHPAPEFSSMTTPESFEENVLSALDYLNSTLPKGSFVMFVGLAQGEVLWHAMHNRTHPVGCTYEEMYDYLNCLQISPCWGWMNSNAPVRALTSLRARQLSAVYPKIIQENTYANFEMAYYLFPLPEAMEAWTAAGGQVWQLIEPSDGFHPSQQANALISQILFDKLVKDHPSAVGAVNPNNNEIMNLFGDQGGY